MNGTNNSPIGLFDSGVGGLTVFSQMRSTLPGEELIYLGDIARTPYGTKSPNTIMGYARECAAFLEQRNVKMIVVACNTVSCVALEMLQRESHVPVIGMVDPAVSQAVQVSKSGRIGLIGTTRTISSNAYVHALQALKSDVQVFSRACPLFVPLVEEGILTGKIVELAIERYLSSLHQSNIDTIILACTHYPLLKQAIGDYLGTQVNIVECGAAAARAVASELDRQGQLADSSRSPQHSYYVTDTGEMFERVAATFLESENVKAIQVHGL